MLKGLGDLGQIMKMQKDMKNIQKRLKKTKIEGQSPNGEVKATVNGEYELTSISIDENFVKNTDIKKIEKAVSIAVNDAVANIKEHSAKEMSAMTNGMDLGALGNMLK